MDIDTFVAHLGDVQERFPMESEKALRRGARQMVRKLQEASPDSGKDHPHKLKDSWRLSMSGTRAADIAANIRSTAPHFHLVERGHVQKTSHGRVVGYKQGTHFMTRTVQDNEDTIMDDIGERLYEAVKDKL